MYLKPYMSRKNLLAYCKRDTWAMVKLHEALTTIH
jgi:hypothetical protein